MLLSRFGVSSFSRVSDCHLFLLAGLLSAMGCGGAQKETKEPHPTEEKGANVAAAPANEPLMKPGPMCDIRHNDENTNVVYSEPNDWFLTVSKDGRVDCDNERQVADIEMAGIHINLTVQSLTPEMGFERAMQQLLEGYISGVSGSGGIVFESPLRFEEKNIGENGRRSFFLDGRFQSNGQVMHLLTSVTGAVNASGDAVFHVVFWTLEETDFKRNEKLAKDTLATVSSSWFRLSDVDQDGRIVTVW